MVTLRMVLGIVISTKPAKRMNHMLILVLNVPCLLYLLKLFPELFIRNLFIVKLFPRNYS